MKTKLAALLGIAFAASVLPIAAHHSFAAEYDASKAIRITGLISKVEWTNPHSRMYVDVKDASGTVTVWNFEFGSPNHLFRAGWSRNTVKEGDQITVEGWGAKDGTHLAQTRQVILADGRKVPGFAGGGDSGGAPNQ